MEIQTVCLKCGASIRLDFGELSKEEALEVAERLDTTSRECPGGHVELGGLAKMWQVRDAVHRAYDLGEGEASKPVISDLEYVKNLQAWDNDVIDGGQKTVPELELQCIHDFKKLEHIGFGNFQSPTHVFLRCDSPRGTRFYIRQAV